MNKEISVIFEDESIIVIDKPAGMPSAPLKKDEEDTALFLVEQICPQVSKVVGKKNIEKGLLHRIDTQTRGLLLFAKTQQAFDFLENEQKENRFRKEYTAYCVTKEPYNSLILPYNVTTFFRPFGPKGKMVAPVTNASGTAALKKADKKLYTTTILNIDPLKEKTVKVNCSITMGYRHQVRSHLSWIGLPVLGDELYGCDTEGNLSDSMQFFATGLEFSHPVTKEKKYFKIEI
jgi:23S rRNA pseudouridine1911/1915/1917 synthase